MVVRGSDSGLTGRDEIFIGGDSRDLRRRRRRGRDRTADGRPPAGALGAGVALAGQTAGPAWRRRGSPVGASFAGTTPVIIEIVGFRAGTTPVIMGSWAGPRRSRSAGRPWDRRRSLGRWTGSAGRRGGGGSAAVEAVGRAFRSEGLGGAAAGGRRGGRSTVVRQDRAPGRQRRAPRRPRSCRPSSALDRGRGVLVPAGFPVHVRLLPLGLDQTPVPEIVPQVVADSLAVENASLGSRSATVCVLTCICSLR